MAWACLADDAGNFTPAPLVAELRVDDQPPACEIVITGTNADGGPDPASTISTEVGYVVTCDETPTEMFDPVYMKKLYDMGLRKARDGSPWQTAPPGLKEAR